MELIEADRTYLITNSYEPWNVLDQMEHANIYIQGILMPVVMLVFSTTLKTGEGFEMQIEIVFESCSFHIMLFEIPFLLL